MLRILALVASCMLLLGCETDIGYALISDEELARKDTPTLVHAYSSVVNLHQLPRVEKVLRDRSVFSEEEWSRIKDRTIRIGDSMDVVMASWGEPDEREKLITASGRTTIWTWERARGYSTVWFDGDRVSLIHN